MSCFCSGGVWNEGPRWPRVLVPVRAGFPEGAQLQPEGLRGPAGSPPPGMGGFDFPSHPLKLNIIS